MMKNLPETSSQVHCFLIPAKPPDIGVVSDGDQEFGRKLVGLDFAQVIAADLADQKVFPAGTLCIPNPTERHHQRRQGPYLRLRARRNPFLSALNGMDTESYYFLPNNKRPFWLRSSLSRGCNIGLAEYRDTACLDGHVRAGAQCWACRTGPTTDNSGAERQLKINTP